MLYQPNFCCQCGSKVERIDWKLWTSRKFCEDCEKSFRQEEWLPRIIVVISLFIGLFGFGSYLKAPEKTLNATANQISLNSSNKVQNLKNASGSTNKDNQNSERSQVSTSNLNSQTKATEAITQKLPNLTPTLPKSNELLSSQTSVAESVYYCGAQTKKGTPCTRRVKDGGRCWQHTGQPAMLPKEKLLINQHK